MVSLLNRGFNDTYLVTDDEGDRRVLRVYNRGKYWIRSESSTTSSLSIAGPTRRTRIANAGQRSCPATSSSVR